MGDLGLTQPLKFQPIFMERIWGGRRIETLFGKRLPPGVRIGESWEIVDRREAQSVVADGPAQGKTLHKLWTGHRREVFGTMAASKRFPLLIKLLDAQEKLSVQVHPPTGAAEELGGEAKTEFWYVADAAPASELYVGLTRACSRDQFAARIAAGTIEEVLHRIPVTAGDAMFLPSGRLHAIGAGNVIVEVQENSDTTYRVFDWNRGGSGRTKRDLQIDAALRCIDFEDAKPALIQPDGEIFVDEAPFRVERWELGRERVASSDARFAIFCCLSGEVECGGVPLMPGEFFLLPASLHDLKIIPRSDQAHLLRITSGRRRVTRGGAQRALV